MTAKRVVRYGSLGYLAVILVAPVGLIFWRAFEHGWHPFWAAISNPDAVHALKLTLEIARRRGAAEHDLRDPLRARDRAAPHSRAWGS